MRVINVKSRDGSDRASLDANEFQTSGSDESKLSGFGVLIWPRISLNQQSSFAGCQECCQINPGKFRKRCLTPRLWIWQNCQSVCR